MVRETGLEPASTYVHMNLIHARLTIPPFPHGRLAKSIIAQSRGTVKHFLRNFLCGAMGEGKRA